MPKVEPLNDSCYTPRVFLADLMEQADDLKDIIAVIQTKKDAWKICYTNLSLEEMCLFHRMLDQHIRDVIADLTIDNPI